MQSKSVIWGRWTRGWLVLVLLALAGCTSLSHHTLNYVGAQRFPPSDPSRVAILKADPSRPFERLGEVVVDASIDPAPSIDKIESTLRADAAKLGADAVVLAYDRTQVTGTWVWGPYWAPSASPIQSRIIVAVAIKYTGP